MDENEVEGVLAFLQRAENLKSTLRYAWTSSGREESTAEHSWRLSLLALLCSHRFPDADPARLLKIAVVHDLGEAICGDVPAPQQTASDGRAVREREAVADLCSTLPPDMAAELLGLWEDYEQGHSREAVIIKALDKLETLIQHNQGLHPRHFDFTFNLNYGKKQTDALPELAELRAAVDRATAANAAAPDRDSHSVAPSPGKW